MHPPHELNPDEKRVEALLGGLRPAPADPRVVSRCQQAIEGPAADTVVSLPTGRTPSRGARDWLPLVKIAAILVLLGAIAGVLLRPPPGSSPDAEGHAARPPLPHERPGGTPGRLDGSSAVVPVGNHYRVEGGEIFLRGEVPVERSRIFLLPPEPADAPDQTPGVIIIETPLETY